MISIKRSSIIMKLDIQSARLFINPITVYNYGFLFNCTTDSMTTLTGGSVVCDCGISWSILLVVLASGHFFYQNFV